jgi:hypothetical protein
VKGSVISAPDPFILTDSGNGSFPAWKRTSNKTRASTALNGGLRNIILLVIGQSQLCNVNPTAFAPTNITKINNFNVLDGGCYQATGSLLGCTNKDAVSEFGNPATRIADLLITNNRCDIVWLITPAIGGTAVAEWDTLSCSQRIAVSVARLAGVGIPASRIDGILWGQGETDGLNGVTQSAYATSLGSVISKSRTLGITAPWFVAQETYGGSTVFPAIQAAQTGIVNHGSGIWAGPNADAIDGTVGNRYDGLHFSDAGAATFATGWYNSLLAFGAPF